MKQGLIESNPILGTKVPSAENRRDRVLRPDELADIWHACGEAGDFGEIV